jgi:alkane 1-monooxygenase
MKDPSMIFSGTSADGKKIEYRDGKRYLWLLSFVFGLIAPFTIGLYYWTGENPLATLFPILFFYIVVPALDALAGEDPHNPPEEVVAAMAQDQFYRRLLHATVPLFYFSFFVIIWFAGSRDLPWWAFLALAYGFGMMHGDVLTIGHELGHKNNAVDRKLAQIVNALIGYGHFCIEHNRGHHVHVSTPEDPASARMGESIYAFALRELPGTFRRGVMHERDRLARKGEGFWSPENEVLQSYAITAVIAGAAIALYGVKMIPFLMIHHLVGWYALTQANYVEHYGLLRQKLPNGKYQPVEPRHSWNTNHIASNLMLFHLQRHSDHHANAQRPYQALRDFPALPRLPSGYPGCYGLAAIPPLWFKVMDPKVMAWADGDLSKVNVSPRRRARLEARYGGDVAATTA